MEEAEAEVIELTLDDDDHEAASVVILSSSDDSASKYVFASYASSQCGFVHSHLLDSTW